MSNLEQTLSIIKPDAVERNLENEIKEMFKSKGFKIVQDKKIQMLSTMLQNLKHKQAQKNIQINQCQNSTQKQLNSDFTNIKKLTNSGLMNTDLNVNIIASPKLKSMINSLKTAKINPLPKNDPKVIIAHLQTTIHKIHNDKHIPSINKNKLIEEMKKFVKNPVGNNKSLNIIIDNLNKIIDEKLRADVVVLLLALLPPPRYEALQNKSKK